MIDASKSKMAPDQVSGLVVQASSRSNDSFSLFCFVYTSVLFRKACGNNDNQFGNN